jgi:hypothetical protein
MTTYNAILPLVGEEILSPDISMGTRVPVVKIHRATTPIEADLVIYTTTLEIQSIVHLTDFVLRVTFNAPALNNDPLNDINTYKFTPPLTVTSVAPENTSTPTYVDITVSEQIDGASYTLEIQRVESA